MAAQGSQEEPAGAESRAAEQAPADAERTELESLRLTVRSLTEKNRRLEAEATRELRRQHARSSERIEELERNVERLELSVEELGRALELERARLARIGRVLPIEGLRRLRARIAGESAPAAEASGGDSA